MAGLDGLEERPEEEALARPFVVLEDGTAEFHYDLWKFRTPLGVLIQCLAVTICERQLCDILNLNLSFAQSDPRYQRQQTFVFG